MSNIKTQVNSITASIVFDKSLDLNKIAKVEEDEDITKLDSMDFPGLMLKLKTPAITFLVFSSGKMVSVGGKSIEESKKAVKKMVKLFQKTGSKISDDSIITIQNIVASSHLERKINLDLADIRLRGLYDPEGFPGLFYRMKDPKVTILLFESGKVVITGAKSEEQIPEAAQKFHDLIEEHGCWL